MWKMWVVVTTEKLNVFLCVFLNLILTFPKETLQSLYRLSRDLSLCAHFSVCYWRCYMNSLLLEKCKFLSGLDYYRKQKQTLIKASLSSQIAPTLTYIMYCVYTNTALAQSLYCMSSETDPLQVCETNYLCESISCWLLVELQLNKAGQHYSGTTPFSTITGEAQRESGILFKSYHLKKDGNIIFFGWENLG